MDYKKLRHYRNLTAILEQLLTDVNKLIEQHPGVAFNINIDSIYDKILDEERRAKLKLAELEEKAVKEMLDVSSD